MTQQYSVTFLFSEKLISFVPYSAEIQSTSLNYQPSQDLKIYPEAALARLIEQCGMTLNTTLAVIGNVITIVLLSQPKMWKSSLHVYMMALALADMTFSFVGMPGRILPFAFVGRDLTSTSEIYCKWWFFAWNLSDGSSSWILACMSCERCLSILMPLKARRFISYKATCAVLFMIHLFLLGIFMSMWFATDIKTHGYCFYKANNLGHALRIHVKPIVNLYIPCTIIFVCNIILIIVLIKAKIHRQEILNINQEKDKTYSTAVMLVVVSVTFFALKAPRQIHAASGMSKSPIFVFPSRKDAVNRLILAVAVWLSFFDHCVNFILYIICNQQFRSELKKLLCSKFAMVSRVPSVDTTKTGTSRTKQGENSIWEGPQPSWFCFRTLHYDECCMNLKLCLVSCQNVLWCTALCELEVKRKMKWTKYYFITEWKKNKKKKRLDHDVLINLKLLLLYNE